MRGAIHGRGRWGVPGIFAGVAVVVFAIAVLVARCGWFWGAAPGPVDQRRVVLRLLHAFSVNVEPALRKLIGRFEAAHPGVSVRLEKAPGNYTTKVHAMMISG